MTMQSKIRRKPIAVRPASRIRREPVRMPTKAEIEKAEARNREREVWGGVAGVILFGAGIAALMVGVSAATLFRSDPEAAAKAAQFEQCYNADGSNCVVDGDTIYVQDTKLAVAGMAVPRIDGAACDAERTQGIAAAVRLQELLNRGNVSVGRAFVDESGRTVRKVSVNGEDVAPMLIDGGAARPLDGDKPDWCAPPDEDE